MLLIEDDTLVHVDSATDILEHYGVKGMKWGKRKHYDRIGFTRRGIERNIGKRKAEKNKNIIRIRQIRGDKTKEAELIALRNRNNDISAINNKAEYKLNSAKDRNRFVRNAAGVAVTAGSLYLSTPAGQKTASDVASRVSDAIRYRSLNVRRRR